MPYLSIQLQFSEFEVPPLVYVLVNFQPCPPQPIHHLKYIYNSTFCSKGPLKHTLQRHGKTSNRWSIQHLLVSSPSKSLPSIFEYWILKIYGLGSEFQSNVLFNIFLIFLCGHTIWSAVHRYNPSCHFSPIVNIPNSTKRWAPSCLAFLH